MARLWTSNNGGVAFSSDDSSSGRLSSGRPKSALLIHDPLQAARILAAGGLVGLPTETVYGLAADAENPAAVARIYAAKGRPADHPLIVHVAAASDLAGWVREVPDYAWRLAERGWPGPMTLVLRRSAKAGDHVTGGQDTVAVRVPDHPLALDVLRAFEGGLAAPSANRFGKVSPTSAADVIEELGSVLIPGRDGVLDGGTSGVGLESAIVDCTGATPRILRPGAVTAEQIAQWGGIVGQDCDDDRHDGAIGGEEAPRAPGMLPAHYAPAARVALVESLDAEELPPVGLEWAGVGLLAPATTRTPSGLVRLAAPETAEDYARALYGALRQADALGLTTIIAVVPEARGIGLAIRDRLARAAAGSSVVTSTLSQ
jgi:L-threonylcarbamoyladenylate synthase